MNVPDAFFDDILGLYNLDDTREVSGQVKNDFGKNAMAFVTCVNAIEQRDRDSFWRLIQIIHLSGASVFFTQHVRDDGARVGPYRWNTTQCSSNWFSITNNKGAPTIRFNHKSEGERESNASRTEPEGWPFSKYFAKNLPLDSFAKNLPLDSIELTFIGENEGIKPINKKNCEKLYDLLLKRYPIYLGNFIKAEKGAGGRYADISKIMEDYKEGKVLNEWLCRGDFGIDSFRNVYSPFFPKAHLNQSKKSEDLEPITSANQSSKSKLDPQGRSRMNLNTIIFGPPGTGKTFSTTALALNAFLDDELNKALKSDDDLSSERSNVWVDLRTSASKIIKGQKPDPLKEGVWATWTRTFHALQKEGRIVFTTFHQNYSYEDFIEGLRADADREAITYRYEHGIFKRLCFQALNDWLNLEADKIPFDPHDPRHGELNTRLADIVAKAQADIARDAAALKGAARPYVLIIDEINRGNIARIFGELITLIEDSKRACFGDDIKAGSQPLWATLPYTRDKLIVPPNLYLLGTMNTADRSLIGLDVALRRRFSFVPMPPQPELLGTAGGVNLSELLKAINNRIVHHLDEDHEIGHAYFLGVNTIGELKAAMLNKVLPQLLEYFHSNKETIVSILATMENGESTFVSIANKRLRVHDRQFDEPEAYNSLIKYGVHPDADQF